MKIKEVFKPRLWKILIFIILFLISNIFFNPLILSKGIDHASIIYGFPMLIIEKWQTTGPFGIINGINFSWIGLIINILFWYFITCLITIKRSLTPKP